MYNNFYSNKYKIFSLFFKYFNIQIKSLKQCKQTAKLTLQKIIIRFAILQKVSKDYKWILVFSITYANIIIYYKIII